MKKVRNTSGRQPPSPHTHVQCPQETHKTVDHWLTRTLQLPAGKGASSCMICKSQSLFWSKTTTRPKLGQRHLLFSASQTSRVFWRKWSSDWGWSAFWWWHWTLSAQRCLARWICELLLRSVSAAIAGLGRVGIQMEDTLSRVKS